MVFKIKKIYNERWDQRHPEMKQRYDRKSKARRFIKQDANESELIEIEELIQSRRNQLGDNQNERIND